MEVDLGSVKLVLWSAHYIRVIGVQWLDLIN